MMLAASAIDAWLEFVGRLHPALLHFPIALGIVAAIVELWCAVRRNPGPSSFALTAVWFAAIIAIATATSGWFNAEFEEKGLTINLFLHRWIGIASAGLLLVLAISGSMIRSRPKSTLSGAWRMTLLGTAGALGFTGHLGGSMVYGDGYITDALWSAIDQTEKSQRDSATSEAGAQLGIVEPRQVQPDQAQPDQVQPDQVQPAAVATKAPVPVAGASAGVATIDFAKQIVPILQAHCYECHGNGKHKGGVHLDDWTMMTTERKGQWVVKPGDIAASLMIRNVELPLENDEAMPPDGDRVPANEIALLREWISQGAPGGPFASPGAVSERRWSIPERSLTPDEISRIHAATSALAQIGVIVVPIAQGSSNYEANASLASPRISDVQLRMFEPLAQFLVALNLAQGAITDAAGSVLEQFQSLRTLRLDHTLAGDQVAESLARIPGGLLQLESINFVATPLTDQGLRALARIKTLRKVYVWSSKTTPAGAEQFRLVRPEVQLIDGRE